MNNLIFKLLKSETDRRRQIYVFFDKAFPDKDFFQEPLSNEEIVQQEFNKLQPLSDEIKNSTEYRLLQYRMNFGYYQIRNMNRNDLCFCGSGLKLKKCCIDLQQKIKNRR